MTSVKDAADVYPVTHLAAQLGRLQHALRESLVAADWGGLRPSHFRTLAEVPPEGISITELGERLHMTKQASGQFVTQLVDSGHVRIRVDPADRRSRIVVRTALGTRTSRAVSEVVERVEADWAERVGARRYAQFRAVVDDLVTTVGVSDDASARSR